MPFIITAFDTVALVCTIYWCLKIRDKICSRGILPPGPKSLPIIGSLWRMPGKEPWVSARQWAIEYGKSKSLRFFAAFCLEFLHTRNAAVELLERRGSMYSNKPRRIMAGELCGCQNMVAFTGYNAQQRRQRRLFNTAFGAQNIPSYHNLLESKTLPFLQALLTDPSAYMNHIRRYAGGLTLSVVYGYEAQSGDDPFLKLAEECLDLLANRISLNGRLWLVDIFPILKHLPSWFPGGQFKRDASIWKLRMIDFVELPFRHVQSQMLKAEGSASQSFCSVLLSQPRGQDGNFENDIKWTANSMYAASADTTITVVSHFILALCLYPEVQAKAQLEIDSVIGQDRLPTFADRKDLPYVEAVYKECLRWAVPVPLSRPVNLHASQILSLTSLTDDDTYLGMRIPKNALVIANIWAMLRDETVFPDAASFIPERYTETVDDVTARVRDPTGYVFGFGRRICPGMHLVDSSLWLLIACCLSALRISKPIDHDGKVVEPTVEFQNPVFRTPEQFQFQIASRLESLGIEK
ncbi:O-methylsterigmatocystin oxidoreductase [Leucoagaricus sp. SymC.cos]|nr:O-methylsterigmatocystin oxidoreductase [Leucoagaricus sp. SymC.cos]